MEMEKLNFREIENSTETEIFISKFQNYTGVRLPLNYIENSKIIGVFLHEKLVAGYIVVTKPGFRSLMFVPDSIKKSNKFFNTDQHDMLEINGLWIGPAVKQPKMQFRIWLDIAKNVILSRKKYLLLMSSSKNKNVQALHALTAPEILYEGSPNLMTGDESYESIRVSFTTPWNCFRCIPKYWMVVSRNRQRRLKIAARQRQLTSA
jgi:hypothetical protein